MNKLKQLIAEVRFGETEADRSHAYKEALLMADRKEMLLRREGLTTAEFKRIIEGMGKLCVFTNKDEDGITVIKALGKGLFNTRVIATISETDNFLIYLFHKKSLAFLGFNQSEIDDICGLIWEYAATPIEKRKEEK